MSADQDKIEAISLAFMETVGVLQDIARLLDGMDVGDQTEKAALLRVMCAAAEGAAASSLEALGWTSRKEDAS